MLKDVWISINSIHGYQQEDEDHLEFTTSHYHVARELQPLMAELDWA